jgi:hypothetical protein
MLFLSGSLLKYSSAPLDAFSQEIESQKLQKKRKSGLILQRAAFVKF